MQRRKVFIVEDTLELSRLYERIFRLSGFEVELSGNGAEALERLERSTELPGVIILDAVVPKVTGVEVLRRLKLDERLSSIPVIVLTNSLGSESEDLFRTLGAHMYLTKMDHEPSYIVGKVNECFGAPPETAQL